MKRFWCSERGNSWISRKGHVIFRITKRPYFTIGLTVDLDDKFMRVDLLITGISYNWR